MSQLEYELADGSLSTEYQEGDTFVVSDGSNIFSKSSVVSLYENDGSDAPLFKLISGSSYFACCNGEAGAFFPWVYAIPTQQTKDRIKRQKEEDTCDSADAIVAFSSVGGLTYSANSLEHLISQLHNDGECLSQYKIFFLGKELSISLVEN